MPTTHVPALRCDTYLSGWLDGTHPLVEDGEVSRTICFSDRVNGPNFCEKLWILLHLQTSPPTYVFLTLMWYRMTLERMHFT